MLQKNKGGRPALSSDDKNEMLRKLEPYLKSGLSLRKSIIEAGIVSTTFYKYKSQDPSFRSKIEHFQQYLSVLLNSSLIKHLHELARKQTGYRKEDGTVIPPQSLNSKDLAFLQWFATTSNLTKEEYGERAAVSSFEPELELQKMKNMINDEIEKKFKFN